ncbi:CbtA family protein [Hoeflea sp. G2-23]|uniref:CbtA family protein n=1 Tax=Hoeflea algicola TaxID=2983763 RepID=A0ABT3Z7K2_9HYPH|nr:CbtA family protein [Hoeflea algicola]MCY0147737.1 CbtA family protein [Hoeflea algicola]
MIVRLLLAALAAGLIAGMVMTPAQYTRIVPLILQAETYENGDAGHAHGVAETDGAAVAAHDHGEEETVLGFGRLGNTVLANLVAGAGFALLLAAVALLTGIEFPAGRDAVVRGLMLGAAGWFSVQLAPAFSLPPAVPGFPYADLGTRQEWWVIAVAASALGLWLIVQRPEWIAKALGVIVIAAPHFWGSPVPEDLSSNVPAYIASAYAAASLATTLFFWLVLGGLLGLFMSRVPPDQTA